MHLVRSEAKKKAESIEIRSYLGISIKEKYHFNLFFMNIFRKLLLALNVLIQLIVFRRVLDSGHNYLCVEDSTISFINVTTSYQVKWGVYCNF